MGCTQSPDLFSTLLKSKLSAAGAAGFSLTQRTTAANLRRYFKPLAALACPSLETTT